MTVVRNIYKKYDVQVTVKALRPHVKDSTFSLNFNGQLHKFFNYLRKSYCGDPGVLVTFVNDPVKLSWG